MNKIILIIKREYLTRVRKRTFIISTLLFPLLYFGVITAISYLGEKSKSTLNVAVIDHSGYFDKGRLARENQKDSSSILTLTDKNADSLRANLSKSGYDALVEIPAIPNWEAHLDAFQLEARRTLGMASAVQVQSKLNSIWTDIKNEKLGISDSTKQRLEANKVQVRALNIKDKTANSESASGIGFVAGILIYIILLIYGSQVMMGVMEEKTNRIAEVIVSSVKPFQLMLGKIVGIGLVALTQFFLWILFIFVVYNITKASAGGNNDINNMVGGLQNLFTSINLPLIIFCFVFYFLGGFFFYASLYAAIGSAVNEDMREAQSLSFPVTMLVIFSVAMLSIAMRDPTGPIAVWGSIIPFSSPIIMMARIPFGVPGTVPWWQLGLSMALLILGFIFTVWLSGKIYRTGILMYGKKVNWKEMIKWAFRRQ